MDQAAEEGSMERTLAWGDSMVGEHAVHGIWGFAKDFGLSGSKSGYCTPGTRRCAPPPARSPTSRR
jgi:hypothetical protein